MPSGPRVSPSIVSPSAVGLVALGGAIGTAARVALLLLPVEGWDHTGVLVANLLGAFLLGVVTTGATATRTPARWRLLLGTGAMGGFTTYSTLAVQTASGSLWLPLVTILGGILAAFAGLVAGRALSRRRRS